MSLAEKQIEPSTEVQITQPKPGLRHLVTESVKTMVIPMPVGNKKSLTDFIEENSKLVSTVGVFFALSVFAKNLPADQFVVRALSFLLFTLALLLFIELLKNFADYDWHGKTSLFRNVLTMAVFAFGYIYVTTYYPILLGVVMMIAVLVTFLLVFISLQVAIRWVLRMSWFNRMNQRARDVFVPVVGAFALMFSFYRILRHFHH